MMCVLSAARSFDLGRRFSSRLDASKRSMMCGEALFLTVPPPTMAKMPSFCRQSVAPTIFHFLSVGHSHLGKRHSNDNDSAKAFSDHPFLETLLIWYVSHFDFGTELPLN